MTDIRPVGIVILNYNTWEKTINCVESIYKECSLEFRIVIVDNCSTNNSFDNLKDRFQDSQIYPNLYIIQTSENGGFSKGNNRGFDFLVKKFSSIEKVILTNNDVIFKSNAIEQLVSSFDLNSRVCITAPLIFDVDGNKTNRPWASAPSLSQILGLKSIDQNLLQWTKLKGPTLVYMVSGCCFAVDVQYFTEIEKLDENVFLYNEENILSYKLYKKGFSIVYNPSAEIIHDHGSTTGNKSIFVDKEFVKSSLYFWRVYKQKLVTTITFIWLFSLLKTSSKLLMRRYDCNRGYIRYVQETFRTLLSVIRNGKY
jgi:hypothetical protein